MVDAIVSKALAAAPKAATAAAQAQMSPGPHWEVAMGSWCLGALIGGIVAYFIVKQEQFTIGAFSAVIGVLLGAGVLSFFNGFAALPDKGVWYYPVGLLLGAAVMSAWAWSDPEPESEPRSKRSKGLKSAETA